MDFEEINDLIVKINMSYSNIIGVTVNAIILISTLIFGAHQLNQLKKSRYAETLTKIYEEIHSQSAIADRDRLFSSNLNNYCSVQIEMQILTERVVDTLNRIAYIACKNLIPAEYIVEMYSGLYVRTWEHLKDYIIGKRKFSGLLNYAMYFEKMYDYSVKYRIRKRYGVKLNLRKNSSTLFL